MTSKKTEATYFDIATWWFKSWEKAIDNSQTTKRAIIYNRVSSKKQSEEWDGLKSQEISCINYAENNWYEIERVFQDEWISWANSDRKWLLDAIRYLEKLNRNWIKISAFICTELSRISRADTLVSALWLEDRIRSTGANIITVQNNIDTTTDEWSMMKDMQFVFAAFERKKNSQRTKQAMISRIQQWYRPFKAPAGYKWDKINKVEWKKSNTNVVKNKHANAIWRWLTMFANWELKNKTEVFYYFEECWVKSNAQNSKTNKLYKQFVDRLTKPEKLYFLAWYLVYPRRWLIEPIKAKHEAIITLHVAKKIISKLYGKKNNNLEMKHKKDTSPDFPLRWSIQCSCGWKVSWSWCKWRNGKKYSYYHCNRTSCESRPYVRAEKLHDQVVKLLTEIKVSKKTLKVFLKLLWEAHINKNKNKIDYIEAKEKAIKELKTKKDR